MHVSQLDIANVREHPWGMPDPTPDLTPVGHLLEGARKRTNPLMSQNAVARRANTSGTTYRNVINGFAKHGGNQVPYSGAPETVAAFARILGVQAFQLREAGRADAADALHDLELDEQHAGRTTDEILDQAEAIAEGTQAILKRLGRDLDTRQRRVLSRHAMRLLEDLEEIQAAAADGRETNT